MATSSMCNGSRSWIACWVRFYFSFLYFDLCFFLSDDMLCVPIHFAFRLHCRQTQARALTRAVNGCAVSYFFQFSCTSRRGGCGTRTMNSSPSAALSQHHSAAICYAPFLFAASFFVKKPNLCFLFAFEIRCQLLYNSLIRGRNVVVCHSWSAIVSAVATATVIESRERKRKRKKCLFIIIFCRCCLLFDSRNANCVRNYRIKLAFYCRFSASAKAISWMFITFLRKFYRSFLPSSFIIVPAGPMTVQS